MNVAFKLPEDDSAYTALALDHHIAVVPEATALPTVNDALAFMRTLFPRASGQPELTHRAATDLLIKAARSREFSPLSGQISGRRAEDLPAGPLLEVDTLDHKLFLRCAGQPGPGMRLVAWGTSRSAVLN